MKNITERRSFNYLKNLVQISLGLLVFYLIFSYFKKEIVSLYLNYRRDEIFSSFIIWFIRYKYFMSL